MVSKLCQWQECPRGYSFFLFPCKVQDCFISSMVQCKETTKTAEVCSSLAFSWVTSRLRISPPYVILYQAHKVDTRNVCSFMGKLLIAERSLLCNSDIGWRIKQFSSGLRSTIPEHDICNRFKGRPVHWKNCAINRPRNGSRLIGQLFSTDRNVS